MAKTLEFDEFLLDADAFELRRQGQPVAVEPLVLELIIDLTRNPGKLRTREDLIESVWKGRIVSDTTISTAIKSARKALGDTDTDKRLIRTVRGRGFQFIANVTDGHDTIVIPEATSPDLPILKIQVATLDDTVSPMMARSLNGRLRAVFNRIPFLSIAASAGDTAESNVSHSGPLHTHHIEVALSSIGDSLHADAVLYDASKGLQKWARHFSMPSEHGLENLLAEIASRAEPRIMAEVTAFWAAQQTNGPHALVLKALQTISGRGWNPTTIREASALLERAISKHSDLPLAHATLSLLSAIGYRVGMLRDDDSAVERAIESAEMALELESESSTVLGLAGCALCDVGQLERGEPIINRALDLDPMNGHAHAAKGAALMMRGDFQTALEPLRTAIKISPADSRLAVWGAILAVAEMLCGDLGKARASAEQAMSRDDVNYMPRLAAVAIHHTRNDQPAFQSALRELLRVHPSISANEIRFFVGKEMEAAIWPAIEDSLD